MRYMKDGYIRLSDLIEILNKVQWEGDDEQVINFALMKSFITQMLCGAPVYGDKEITLSSCADIPIQSFRTEILKPEKWDKVSAIAKKLEEL